MAVLSKEEPAEGRLAQAAQARLPETEDLLLRDGGSAFFKVEAEIGLHPWIRAAIRLVGPFGYSAGMLMPDRCLILKKRPR
jgi:hypothetical protein